MQISVDKQIQKILQEINAMPEQVLRASISAVNRTADWLKGKLAKDISAQKRIKLKLIRDRISMQRANKRDRYATLFCNFKSIYIKDLGGVKQTPIGVVAGGKMYPHAFIANLGKNAGVYRRKTKKRFPLESVTIQIFDDAAKVIEDLVGTEAKQFFEKRFIHELHRVTGAL